MGDLGGGDKGSEVVQRRLVRLYVPIYIYGLCSGLFSGLFRGMCIKGRRH